MGVKSMKELENRNVELHGKAADAKVKNMFTSANIGLRDNWYSDAVFAQQWFTGTNPTAIAQASPQWVQTFIQAAKGNDAMVKLLTSAPANSLYIVDNSFLRAAAGIDLKADITSTSEYSKAKQYGCAPVALFHLPDSGELHPLAIILDWKGSLKTSVTIFNKRIESTSPTDGEKPIGHGAMRRCASRSPTGHDMKFRFIFSTLILSRKSSLSLLSAQRTFVTGHPVYDLLRDHWTTTLSINALARSTLLPKVLVPLIPFTEAQLNKFIATESPVSTLLLCTFLQT